MAKNSSGLAVVEEIGKDMFSGGLTRADDDNDDDDNTPTINLTCYFYSTAGPQ